MASVAIWLSNLSHKIAKWCHKKLLDSDKILLQVFS